MKKENDFKVALVTGGGGAIGEATCFELAKRGIKVIVADINLKKAEEVAEKVCNISQKGIAMHVDVADEKSVKKMFENIYQLFEKIDILVNIPAYGQSKAIIDTSIKEYEKTMDVCMKGTFLCTKEALRSMIKYKNGNIINISSAVSGRRGGGFVPKVSVYAAAKAAIIGFTKAAARDHAKDGININCVCPGWTLSEKGKKTLKNKEQREQILSLIPMDRAASPDEIASVIGFLASVQASYVTGEIINVDGGAAM